MAEPRGKDTEGAVKSDKVAGKKGDPPYPSLYGGDSGNAGKDKFMLVDAGTKLP